MRLIGLDVGTKRIGIAVSDPLGVTAQNKGFVTRANTKLVVEQLRELIDRHNVSKIVIGLPLNMNGSEGGSARLARNFSRELEHHLKLPVVMWDERLSTAEADRSMKEAGLSRKKRSSRLDGLAAQLILQSYLDSHR